jgi:hypothetical protein
VKNFLSRLLGSRRPSLYLHIGLPKTGTSAIQGLLFDNTEALDSSGYIYPRGTIGGDSDFAYAHHNLARAAFEKDAQTWDNFQAEINSLRKKKILVSSETFSNCRHIDQLEFIAQYLEPYNTNIVVYLRRQDDFLQALYQTIIVYGDKTMPFDEFFQAKLEEHDSFRAMDYYFLVNDLFASVFGKDRIILKVYEKSQLHQRNLLKDFLKTVGFFTTQDFVLDVKNTNLSFDARRLDTYRRLKKVFHGEAEFLKTARRIIRDNNKRQEFLPNNIISAEQSALIMERVRESNEKLAREYLGRSDGELFSESFDSAMAPANTASDEEIADHLEDLDPARAERYRAATRAD